ncbi:MAG: tRNA (adenosine(37)-N6)-threonylcarbamoyltransferase complex dimerization subunit type 1 TsaB [Thermodesulfobacteriota bacterium]
MKILTLDTATETGGVGLLEGEELKAQAQIRVSKTHTGQLWKIIYFLLEEVGWDLAEVELFGVTIGPGSFTGLRIGLATIKGLALAGGKPVIGVSTLEALAHNFPSCPYLICPMIDARKKEVFSAFFQNDPEKGVVQIGQPRHVKPEFLLPELQGTVLLAGNGARLYADFFKKELGDLVLFPTPHLHLISPLALGALAYQRFLQQGAPPLEALHPIYIRPSDAELKCPV